MSIPASFAGTEQLALAGGTPVCDCPLVAPAWPPTDPSVGDRLREVYLGRKWSFNGPQEHAFEQEFASHHGAKHGIFMVNGTVTLQCALAAHGIGAGDEVIVPALTWLATAMAVRYLGATPVFADIDPATLCLDPVKAAQAITPRTRAILPVHLYGSMADMDAIMALARRHDLIVIEDCAHAHGGKWAGRGLGSIGHVGSFSFQQSKALSTGEGGMCITNDTTLAERLHRIKHIGYGDNAVQGAAPSGPPAGLTCHNFRATEFAAVIGRAQLRGLDARIAGYNSAAARIEARLAGVPGVRVQARGRRAGPQSYYAMVILLEGPLAAVPRQRLAAAFAAEGFNFGATYGPVYKHMLFNLPPSDYHLPPGGCPVAEGPAHQPALVIPHYWLGADDATIDAVAAIVAKIAASAAMLRAMEDPA